jgi:GNAT superfamily N-acetyltransferase
VVDTEKYSISKLNNTFNIRAFFCGETQIDDYIKKYALINQYNNIGQTWILHDKNKSEIIGYYTISNSQILISSFPQEYTKNLPKYPVPCILIGKLGVDRKCQGQGFGEYLLYDSLKRIKDISINVGCNAAIIDAINDKVADYYSKNGFIRFKEKPNSLYLPVKDIP